MHGSLTKFACLMRDPDPNGARKLARELYHDHGILIVLPGDHAKVDTWWIEAIGKKLYGVRK